MDLSCSWPCLVHVLSCVVDADVEEGESCFERNFRMQKRGGGHVFVVVCLFAHNLNPNPYPSPPLVPNPTPTPNRFAIKLLQSWVHVRMLVLELGLEWW